MREILFKAKRLDNGEWVEGNLILSNDAEEDYKTIIIPNTDADMFVDGCVYQDLGFEKWYIVDPSTICQYTGLTDKNGNKIWENDILSYSYDYPDSPWLKADGKTNKDIVYKKGQVFWQGWRGTWAVTSRLGKKGGNQDVFVYCRNPNRTEVIGNVFDNAELLEDSCTNSRTGN